LVAFSDRCFLACFGGCFALLAREFFGAGAAARWACFVVVGGFFVGVIIRVVVVFVGGDVVGVLQAKFFASVSLLLLFCFAKE
jgi:hypothetical protein